VLSEIYESLQMKKLSLISLLIFPTLLQAGQPSIGDPLPSSAKALAYKVMIAPALISPAYAVFDDSINFIVSVDDDDKLNYISTNDSRFATSENLKIGDTFRKATHFRVGEVKKEPGWCYWVQLSSGWKAAFSQGPSATEGNLDPNSRIQWFFRR